MSRDPNSAFIVGLDTRLPEHLEIGAGNALNIAGYCHHLEESIVRLEVLLTIPTAAGAGARPTTPDPARSTDSPSNVLPQDHLSASGRVLAHPVRRFGYLRKDVYDSRFPRYDPKGLSLHSGFWTTVPLPPVEAAAELTLSLQATLRNRQTVTQPLGTFLASASAPLRFHDRTESDTPRVIICMATYNPSIELFARQIASLQNQTHPHWVCIVSDDHSSPEIYAQMADIISRDSGRRFHLFPNANRLGFYGNFERALARACAVAPDDAAFVCLSDQDDYWHPDKISRMLAAFSSSATALACHDLRVVAPGAAGEPPRVVVDTYWTTRTKNHDDLEKLLLANTVTGATTMFRASLLAKVLPFPRAEGALFHDQWIACTARAAGEIAYIDAPLADYTQHAGQVVGHRVPERAERPVKRMTRLIAPLLGPFTSISRLRASFGSWEKNYEDNVRRLELMATVLRIRFPELRGRRRRIVRQFSELDTRPGMPFCLLWAGIKDAWQTRPTTVGAEANLLLGLLWRKIRRLQSWLGRNDRARHTRPGGSASAEITGFEELNAIRKGFAPLAVEVDDGAPARVNLLIPTVNLKHFFGGYISKFHLAQRLVQAGHKVRVVTIDPCPYTRAEIQAQLAEHEGLAGLLERVELVFAADRSTPFPVSPKDVFLATYWRTAQIAHQAVRAMGRNRFIYLIQEYEPFVYPMGAFAAMAAETYTFPHLAIFSTDLLRDYFKQNRIGVYAADAARGDHDSLFFENAIIDVGPVNAADLEYRKARKLLFYARPEAHAARNLFAIGVLALCNAIEAGVFAGQTWEFNGVGTVNALDRLSLPRGARLKLLPRLSPQEYRQLLRQHDLGLSLMYTPHPSLVPIEMTSAGMLVVTNTFANKTSERLRAISQNFVAAPPTIGGVQHGLADAVQRLTDYTARAEGSQVRWSRDWDSALPPALIDQTSEFIRRCRRTDC